MKGHAFDRREFAAITAGGIASTALTALAAEDKAKPIAVKQQPFTLKYAPHFGMFQHSAGKDLVDQLSFAFDQGFRAWEDNEMKSRPVREQERIAAAMQRLGMEMGVISALRGVWSKVNFAAGDEASRKEVLKAVEETVPAAKRVHAKWLTVVPGMANKQQPREFQTASCIDLLKRCCDIVEPHGLVMVLEPLNPWRDHPGVFLSTAPQADLLCQAVNRPSCKILFDIYHQQIATGNLINNIKSCWDQIAYFQTADTPGRKEPGTGEINYANVLAEIERRGYTGVVGMEHGNSRPGKAGEVAVIKAYRDVDPKPT